MTDALVRTSEVGWRAGSTAILERVNLDVAAGELVAITGRNGAGKSTLLDIISGLRPASAGTVSIANRALGDWTAAERAQIVAHLPQAVRTDLTMSAETLVLMGRYAHASQWFESDDDREIARAAMERCHCWEYRERTLGTLSGGERQRVLLAACLAQQPRVLLLDEPTTFLDVDQQLQCFALLRDEASRGTACLAVTHDLNLALTFCSRIVVLADRSIAHDMPVRSALDDASWLGVFSDRLRLELRPDAPAWVRYQ